MGLCSSTEREEREQPKTGDRPGNKQSNRPGNRPSRLGNRLGDRPGKMSAVKGQKLGSQGAPNTADSDATLTAKELAAKAANQRLQETKKKNEKGVLGKKLAEERKKTAKDVVLEAYEKKKNDQLTYE
ncbi:hypothetical protein FOA43_002950 [Brettanomyces nanus]|uniref:Uncharacterized protein n=1 Tax=Eeniella nana TaxID=13502 RepID=A0A875S3W7_EENNA|nr:uncharacterized protein FOA43_002950 [Brettanomyces nanus]QPG75593.1 hypothetical protein FOA43_002950 [Brettanomyces nanus]